MNQKEEAELLRAVREATREAERLRAAADAASAERKRATQEAMDAGIPRQKIMDALGVSARSLLYRIIED